MDEIYQMWQYARQNAETDAQRHESLADDLDAAYGIGTWRLTRNMDEQPKAGERAVVFTYADGDNEGDFQIICPDKRPKMAIVMRFGTSATIEAVCFSARQAEHIRALAYATSQRGVDYEVEMHAPCMDMSRVGLAKEYIDNDSLKFKSVMNHEILDEKEAEQIEIALPF